MPTSKLPASVRRQRQAAEADRRGRRVKPTVRDFERAARRSPKHLAETLLARHNVRMVNLMQLPSLYRINAIEALGPVPLLDAAHRTLGQPLPRVPVLYTGSWPRDLAWGVDSAVAAVRLLLAGQVVGAAVVARQQLERWTVVLASVLDLSQGKGEATGDYLARAWTAFLSISSEDLESDLSPMDSVSNLAEPDAGPVVEPSIDHAHAVLSDGTVICPAVIYSVLSEVLHARECLDITTWDAQGLLRPDEMPIDAAVAVGAVADAISLCLIQIGMATAAALRHAGDRNRAALLADYRSWHHRFSQRDAEAEAREWWTPSRIGGQQIPRREKPSTAVVPELAAIMPLAPAEGLRPGVVAYLHARQREYGTLKDGVRPAGRLYRDDEMVTLVFDAHRYSATRFAQQSLAKEARIRGDSFDVRSLTHRGAVYILISELAGVSSVWTSGTVSEALQNVSSTLRSAYWMWLEDDDRAMACLRSTLEQSARVMVSITKPSRATKLETPETPPSRWVEAAGWGRLSLLNQALGEYVHAHRKLDPVGPRLLLDSLQMNAEFDEQSTATARGNALSLVAELAARSILVALARISPALEESATRMLEEVGVDLSKGHMELVLNHALSVKNSRSSSRKDS